VGRPLTAIWGISGLDCTQGIGVIVRGDANRGRCISSERKIFIENSLNKRYLKGVIK